MKNSQRLLRAIGQVDESFVASATRMEDKPGKREHTGLVRWVSVAASLAVAAGVGIGVWQSGMLQGEHGSIPTDKRWPEKIVAATGNASGERYPVLHWDEKNIGQQYTELSLHGAVYTSVDTTIGTEYLGAVLDPATAQGYDAYTDAVYTQAATIYAITGISADCAVAARFDGVAEVYVYTNSGYRPATLGDLIDDLDLESLMTFGSLYYNWKTEDKPITTVEFPDVDASVVWEMLLSDRSLANVADDVTSHTPLLSVSVNIPLLGYENIGLWVTSDGYLVTNILATAKVFYLGADKTQAFVRYVADTCEGYELIYTDGIGEIPE